MKNLKISVVVKKSNKWFIGYISDGKYIQTMEIKKLSDAKKHTRYRTLKSYLKEAKMEDEHENILNMIGCDSVYVLNKPILPDRTEFENYWWAEINDLCKDCKKLCKQSSKVVVEKCESYSREEN